MALFEYLQQLKLVPGTVLYPTWLNPAVRQFNVYVMNVTNAEDVLHGAKPALEEIGPYVYM